MASQSTRTSILEAAVLVYGQSGSQGFSMRAVATEAEITATAIYRHYPDKAALAQALVEKARGLLGAYLFEGSRGANSLERLWSCADSYVAFVLAYPQLYRLLFLDPISGNLPDVLELQANEHAAPFRFVVDRIREAMDDEFLTRDDPGRVALSAWSQLHGLCTLRLAGRLPGEELHTIARASLNDLIQGIRRRSIDENDKTSSPL